MMPFYVADATEQIAEKCLKVGKQIGRISSFKINLKVHIQKAEHYPCMK